MKRVLSSCLVVALTVGLGFAAHAEGVFVEGATFWHHYNLAQPGETGLSRASGTTGSGKLALGYESGSWAVEGGYVNLGRPSHRYALNAINGKVSTSGDVWYVAATVLSLQPTDKLSFNAKVGLSRHRLDVKGEGSAASMSAKTSKTDCYLAAGVEYAVTPQLASTLAIENFGKQKKPGGDLIGLSMGFKYRF